MGDIALTDEQKEFLAECEEEFKDRYTENDDSFMEIKKQKVMKPPIIDPWYNKPRRPYDWSRNHPYQNRRNHHSDRRNDDKNERWERHAGKHMHRRQRMY